MRLPRRPVPLALLLGIAAEALFLFRVGVPSTIVFDETHYVPAARALRTLAAPANTEHPLFGKALIALSIMLFGDDSFGWRALSTLAATAVVMGTFAIAWLLWRRPRPAVTAAALATLNFTIFVQARIAMLDGFMTAFVITGIAALLWAMRAPVPGVAWRRWLLGAALLGLGIGCKWTALPYVGFAGLGFLWVRWRDRRRLPLSFSGEGRSPVAPRSVAGPRPSPEKGEEVGSLCHRHWPGMATLPALLALGLTAALAYFVTFAPAFFYAREPMTLAGLIPFQAAMFHQQTQVLPPHTYQSSWWTWPLDLRPIWYLYERTDGAQRGILLIGNPAVMWGGLVAVAACLWSGWRERDARLLAVAGLWIASVAMWAIIPKSLGFFYYYYLSSVLIALPIAGALGRHARGRFAYWDESYLILVLGLFIYFFPILAALPLAGPQSFRHWMWLKSWP